MLSRSEWMDRWHAYPETIKADPPEFLYDTGLEVQNWIYSHITLPPKAVVLDIGCGTGRLATQLAGTDAEYIGVEVRDHRVRLCHHLYAGFSNMRFSVCDIANGRYNRHGKQMIEYYMLPVSDSSVDLVICSSLFTHMPNPLEVERYFYLIERALKPGGTLYATWLLDPPMNRAASSSGRAVYLRPEVKHFYRSGGWKILETRGDGNILSQRAVLSRKAA